MRALSAEALLRIVFALTAAGPAWAQPGPAAPLGSTAESFEFVAEHLAEVAMDDRFALLPVWSDGDGARAAGSSRFAAGVAFASVGSGGLTLDGPLASLAVERSLNDHRSIRAFGFVDALDGGGEDVRPLETLFALPPLGLPATARFTDFRGRCNHTGVGLALNGHGGSDRHPKLQWSVGALYQSVELRGYQASYRVLDGPATGVAGVSDYSATYRHWTPFVGLARSRSVGKWNLRPHALLAVPVPRRGVGGRITGPGFDLAGDTAAAGNGKHFGDPSVTLGLDASYEPWGLSLDLGTLASQALLEPLIHEGVDASWVISMSKRF